MLGMKVRPVHLVLLVVVLGGLLWGTNQLLRGGFRGGGHETVPPTRDGILRLDMSALKPLEVRFFRYVNVASQEVWFFAGRDAAGVLQVAFDANEECAKLKRGYRHQGEWVVCNKCDKSFRLAEVNAGGGGCKPVPLAHRVEGDLLVLTENDLLQGWRLFR